MSPRHQRRSAKALAGAMALAGALLIANGLYIPAKAELAQHLLNRAWDKSRVDGVDVPPWPWADTYPVARLKAKPASYQIDQVVLAGASGRNLAFGPTHVAPSAMPGHAGHVVISGHRDTHFEWLADLRNGDRLTLEGHSQLMQYEVFATQIIDLDHSQFLIQPDQHILSLVTCYPFDAITPNTSQRFIVHAAPVDAASRRFPFGQE